jgi:hypothetical protein
MTLSVVGGGRPLQLPSGTGDVGPALGPRERLHVATAATFTIKDVVHACGLPQPVIAQLVPRTWADQGWMYTRAQLEAAIDITCELRQ